MIGLVSFCVFGADEQDIYYGGAIENARLYTDLRPGWRLRYYLGTTVPPSVERRLCTFDNVQTIRMADREDQTSTYWRFLAIKDTPDTDFIIFRDVDSRPSERELDAVDEWLMSPFPYHMMRDHPYHGRKMMSGMWGLKSQVYSDIGNHLPDRLEHDYYQTDQVALEYQVWPWAKRKIMVHIGCFNLYEKVVQRRCFRVPRDPGTFVGQGVTATGEPRSPGHELMVVSDEEIRKHPLVLVDKYR